MQLFGVWRFVEIEVTAKHFVRTFAGEHHLDAHRFDLPRHQIHRRGGANGGHIIGFNVIDHIADRIQTFLYGEVNFMVHRAKMVRHFLGGFQVRCPFQTHGKGVQLWPPGFRALLIFHATCGEFLGDRGDHGGVQTAGEQYTVGDI